MTGWRDAAVLSASTAARKSIHSSAGCNGAPSRLHTTTVDAVGATAMPAISGESAQQPPRRLAERLPPVDRRLLRPTGMWVARRIAFLALAKHRAQLEVEDSGADAASAKINPQHT